jgi:hypothetical protein
MRLIDSKDSRFVVVATVFSVALLRFPFHISSSAKSFISVVDILIKRAIIVKVANIIIIVSWRQGRIQAGLLC